MKKFLVVLVLATLVAGGAFAQISLSAGAGVNLGVYSTDQSKGENPDPRIGFGFHGFFDAKYVVAKLGLYIDNEEYSGYGYSYKYTNTYFSIGILGKFPIEVGSFTIFPMLGFEYLVILSYDYEWDYGSYLGSGSRTVKRGDMNDPDEYDYFIFQFGVGADFNITESIYIRPTLLWGIDLNNTESKNDIDYFCHKLDIGVSVGFKF